MLKAALTANPALRVLIGCGVYDLICEYYGNEWAARNMEPAFRNRVAAKSYLGGHAMYTDPDVHVQFKRDVAQFIRETLSTAARQ